MQSKWTPIRKVLAAAIGAVIAAPAFIAWLSAGGDLDWRSLVAVALAAAVPVVIAYLVPPAPVPPGGEPVMGKVSVPAEETTAP